MTASTELPRFDIVFLDMDGVLADFQGAACKAHNKLPPAELAASGTWKPGDWDMPTVFGMNKEKFWRKIDEAPDFWAGLPALRDIKALFDLAQQLAPVARILTTPHGHASSYSGKWDWRQHHIPPAIKLCMVESSADKALLARPGRLLIDDSDENVDAFRAAGGSAILFPQHWNSAHDRTPFGPLFYLAQELEKLAQEQRAVENFSAERCYWDSKNEIRRRESDGKPHAIPTASAADHPLALDLAEMRQDEARSAEYYRGLGREQPAPVNSLSDRVTESLAENLS